ncbi:MAG: class I SAM-dependent methyltransferase [Candidatus Kapaibacteriales bacterium]
MKNRTNYKFNEIWQKIGLPDYNSYFWEYQYVLGKDYIVPFFRSKGFFLDGFNVCEIGSAEGGVLFAFAENGGNYCLGTDIAENRLMAGEKIADYFNQRIEFSLHDILTDEIPNQWQNKFHIVILRDVIEHLDDPKKALENIAKLLTKNGVIYITFPPYFSPFGGHQHLLHNFWGKFPFIHWLPNSIFTHLVKNGRKLDVEEVLRLKKNRFTLSKFYLAVNSSGLEIRYQRFYLLRPVYKIKFGFPTVPIPNWIKSQFLRNVLSTEAEIILGRRLQ